MFWVIRQNLFHNVCKHYSELSTQLLIYSIFNDQHIPNIIAKLI